MSWYKCIECGHIFEEGEQKIREEYRGECCGRPAYEKLSVCPLCEGFYDDAVRCKKCGSLRLNDELTGGLCDECVEEVLSEYRYDICGCVSVAEKGADTTVVVINGFLASMFDTEEINKILYRELISASAVAPVDCKKYIEQDKEWFVENATKEVRK